MTHRVLFGYTITKNLEKYFFEVLHQNEKRTK